MKPHTRLHWAAIVSAVALAVPAASAAAAPATAAPATAASAAGTWSVSPGGLFSMAGMVSLKDVTTGTAVTCEYKFTGTLESGSGLKGTDLATITSLTVSNCAKVEGLLFSISGQGFPWMLNALSYSKGSTTASLSGIEMLLSTTGCGASVAGVSANSPGMEKLRYNNSTHKVTFVPSTSNLHFWDVDGCFGIVGDGDPAELIGTLSLSPAQTITES
jgi:hypothetical protein